MDFSGELLAFEIVLAWGVEVELDQVKPPIVQFQIVLTTFLVGNNLRVQKYYQ